jgi:hypothetical protein
MYTVHVHSLWSHKSIRKPKDLDVIINARTSLTSRAKECLVVSTSTNPLRVDMHN